MSSETGPHRYPLPLRFSLLLSGFVLAFLALEILSRLFWAAPQSVVITDLSPAKIQKDVSFIEAFGKADAYLFEGTKTGARLTKNIRAIIKNHYLSGKDVTIETNSLGYRYRELAQKTERDHRILVLGDSITLGDYLPEDQTYTYLLEKKLNQNRPSDLNQKNFEVINSGVGSINTENELAILYETGLSIKPDTVLVELYLNDANSPAMLKILKPPAFLNQKSHLLSLLMNRINLYMAGNYQLKLIETQPKTEASQFALTYRIAEGDWQTDDKAFNKMIYDHYWDWGYAWSDNFWLKTEQLMRLLKQAGIDNNFRLVVAIFPVKYQVQSVNLRNEPQLKFEQVMKDAGIEHIDLLPALREKYLRDKEDLYYDHCHYKVEGNDFIAGVLHQYFLNTNLIDVN